MNLTVVVKKNIFVPWKMYSSEEYKKLFLFCFNIFHFIDIFVAEMKYLILYILPYTFQITKNLDFTV